MSRFFIWSGIYFILIIILLQNGLIIGCSGGGIDERGMDMLKFAPDKIDCWSLADDPESYDRETIFDYIDGAGEVYLSYDFREVGVFRYRCQDEPDLVLEIFDMGSPADAFGIFSYSRESETRGIGQDSEDPV